MQILLYIIVAGDLTVKSGGNRAFLADLTVPCFSATF